MEYVRIVKVLPFSVGEVWGLVAGFGSLRTWMVAAESCSLEGAGVGAVRTVKAMGGVTRERLTLVDPATYRVSYALEDPTILPAKGVQGHMSLRAVSPTSTEVTWASTAEWIDPQHRAMLEEMIRGFYEASLTSLERSLTNGCRGAR